MAVSIIHIVYFGMVLGGELQLCVAFLGAVQIPASIGAVLATRMWMYT